MAPLGGLRWHHTLFNFPAMVPMWMFPLAIACGNAFVLKPEKVPSTALILAELLHGSWLLAQWSNCSR